jgi:hypothetical protein
MQMNVRTAYHMGPLTVLFLLFRLLHAGGVTEQLPKSECVVARLVFELTIFMMCDGRDTISRKSFKFIAVSLLGMEVF